MSTTAHATKVPLVVAYDVMREAANRLAGRLVALADVENSDEAVARSVLQVRDIRARVAAVDADDVDAIQCMDAELRAAYAKLPTP